MTGTSTWATMSGTARAASSLFTVTRTSSEPAWWRARTWATVPSTSAVSVLVIDWTTIGWAEPTGTPPTEAVTVRRRGVMVMAPSFSLGGDPLLTGAVLGPDGTSSICNSLPDPFGSVLRVRPIDPAAGDFAAPVQLVRCSVGNTFTFNNLAPGSYLLRAILPSDPAIGTLPVRDVEPVTMDGGDVVHDIVVHNGTALGGRATLDGAPLADVSLTFVYDAAPGFGAAFGGSGPDGAWTECFRSPLILQNDVRYRTGCAALGVKLIEGPPSGGFLFPSVGSAINCTMVTAPAVQFSHTPPPPLGPPLPGDIGGGCRRPFCPTREGPGGCGPRPAWCAPAPPARGVAGHM